MLTNAQIDILLNRPRDTQRTPVDTIQRFFDTWIAFSEEQKQGGTPEYSLILPLCSLTWLEKPVMHNGFPVQQQFADSLLQGMLESYEMHSLEPVAEPQLQLECTSCVVPVVVHFSVPVYPDPEKDEFYMKDYRRKMNIRCLRESAPGVLSPSGEWNVDPNSILDQECA